MSAALVGRHRAHHLLLLIVSESFTLALILFARRALVRDMSPICDEATVYATSFLVLLG
jgi:hypothetical protein